MRRPWFSLVVTKKRLMGMFAGVVGLVLVVAAASIYQPLIRSLNGVKSGVTVAGHDVSGLFKEELYDALISISEDRIIDARNASYDWAQNLVTPERVGQVIDINATVEMVMEASAKSELDFVTVPVIPSITQANFSPYYRGDPEKAQVSLMVNVDWGNEYIPSMLETFKHYEIQTSWFLTGNWAEKFPDLAAKIANAGHEIGNHGGWHGMASQMSSEQVRDLILSGEDKIMDVTGQKPMLFAPPAGDFKSETVAVAAELGYKTILWTVDTVDWQRPAPTVIIDRVVSRISNGAFVLMHPTQPTADALPLIIEQLQKRGFSILPVSQILNQ